MNQKVGKFLISKIVRFLILLIAVAIFSFVLIQLSPIDPVNAYLKELSVSATQRAALEAYFGVNTPLPTKILNWLIALLHGDLGISLIYRIPVIDVIANKFAASIALMSLSWILSGVIGFGLGVVAGKNKNTWIDKAVRVYCYILQCSPAFWVGLLLLMIFGVYLHWFPVAFGVPIGVSANDVSMVEWLSRLVLPTAALSMVGVAPIALYTRNELVEVLNTDYIRFAKSRGEAGWDLIKRHMKNILLPAITLQFLSFNELFGGAVLVEQVFSYPGIGQAAVSAGLQSDVPLLLGVVLFSAVFVFVGNFLADIIYYFVDPRIKENEYYD